MQSQMYACSYIMPPLLSSIMQYPPCANLSEPHPAAIGHMHLQRSPPVHQCANAEPLSGCAPYV